ncbi:MAG: endopeptidase La [Spirochaetales bacterium]|nr:endopeptidase La [Spirochaetales bacterium]
MSENQILPVDQALPTKLYIMPIQGKPIFPGIFTPIMIHNSQDVDLANRAMEDHNFMGLILVKNEDLAGDHLPEASDLYQVGSVVKIVKKLNLPDGGMNLFISTIKRFRIKKVISNQYPITAAVQYIDEPEDNSAEVKALTRALISEMKQLSENNPLFSEEMRLNMVNIDHPGKIADFIVSILNIDRKEQQNVLETIDLRSRMETVLLFIKKEQELLQIQKKIQKQIDEKISKSQREYFLKEQLKAIKEELGMTVDAKSKEYQTFKDILDKLDLKGEVKEKVDEELDKFRLMDPGSSEFIVTRNYLDLICHLPWGKAEIIETGLDAAQAVLDKDHFGLEDVKTRIIEYLAVRSLKKDSKGSIICLVGPPGVGKTSVGKSIARALGKEFFRFSVGGMRDEAEIKGHRRTYVGAMSGKIIQGLKIVKKPDPVFMIDEIDKLGASYQGDPSSALLEVLDPEQNVSFRDHYLDLPFDISNILFITTANTLDTIPGPLLDRMEVIRLSGYINDEKVAIAKKYLIPKSLEEHGLGKNAVKYDKAALLAIAEGYAREAGLRNFEKYLDTIHRKIAKSVLLNEVKLPVSIKETDLISYLKQPVFNDSDIKRVSKAGMAIGLAWTSLGGATLTIEAVAIKGREGFKLTGQMGEVMQESANIAYTYVRQIAEKYGVGRDFFENHMIHLHIPAGATPKDGPSAGITMASCLLSLVTSKMLRKNLAMTGELSLVGSVLPIGGLKEKTIAAKRNKIKEIIIPHQNLKDLEEIPDHIKKGIQFHALKTMEEVVEKIF